MSRASAVAARVELEDPSSPHALLCFLTISHAALAEPIRVVSDVMNYVLGGQVFVGMPFGFRLLTDGEASPRTQIKVQNVDRIIGQALRSMTGRAGVQLQLVSSADFDLGQDPRVEVGTAAEIYGFAHFSLVNVNADVSELTGEVILQDYSVEPWPNTRATEELFPGLYR